METVKKILMLLGIICPIILFFILSKPKVDDSNIKSLENKCDSLQNKIHETNLKIDSFNVETKKLVEKSNKLKTELTLLNKKTKELKKQHEKDIDYINSLSNNDVANVFANEFKDID